jgi:hypothetical protein
MMNANDLTLLENATDAELLAVLGVQALPLVQRPSVTLSEGRSGAFAVDGSDALGIEFQHGYFEKIARAFLRGWAVELGRAVCGKGKTYASLKRRAVSQTDVIVGVIAASITQHVPEIAPYTGLVAVLGTLIARTGVEGFCTMLKELQSQPSTIDAAADPPTKLKTRASVSKPRKQLKPKQQD